MCGQACLSHSAGDRRRYNCRTMLVSNIILNYKYGSYPTLLASNHRAQISVIYISPPYRHFTSFLSDVSFAFMKYYLHAVHDLVMGSVGNFTSVGSICKREKLCDGFPPILVAKTDFLVYNICIRLKTMGDFS